MSLYSTALAVCCAAILFNAVLIACAPAEGGGQSPEGREIVQCNLVYRHGQRSPLGEYPESKYRDVSSWQLGWQQLTTHNTHYKIALSLQEGAKQHLRFGRWLMKTYGPQGNGLIGPFYNASEYRIISTDVDRTIMSGLANTAGMFQPPASEAIAPNILWNPVPLRAVPTKNDTIFALHCPLVSETIYPLFQSYMKQMSVTYPDVFSYAQKNSGLPVMDSPMKMLSLYDALNAENSTFGTIPDWAETLYPEPLTTYIMGICNIYSSTSQLRRITGGPLLKHMLSNMVKKTNGTEEKKFLAYSAHDNTVYSVMAALGIFLGSPPGFSASAIFELYKSPGDIYSVRVLYRSGPDLEPVPQIVPGCNGAEYCPLETLLDATKDVLPTDILKECVGSETPDPNIIYFTRHENQEKLLQKLLQ